MPSNKTVIKKIKEPKKTLGILDVIIISILLIAIILSFVAVRPITEGDFAEVYQKDTLLAKLSLEDDTEFIIDIDGPVHIIVENHYIFVSENTCKNQICVNTPKINKTGQRILCAPKGIIIVIRSNKATDKHYVTG